MDISFYISYNVKELLYNSGVWSIVYKRASVII
jgi:hypothetical protein